MASIVVNGDTSGSVTLSAPAVAGSTVLTLPSTSGTVLTTASGQWITSGSDIYYNTGNVGIGTTSPQTKLQVSSPTTTASGSSAWESTGATLNVFYTGTGATDAGSSINLSTLAVIKGAQDASGAGNGYLSFMTRNGSGGQYATERMRIDSSGIIYAGGTTSATSTNPIYSKTTARAWCNYYGPSQTITGSFNISSVTYNAAGDYVFNLTNAAPNSNGALFASKSNQTTNAANAQGISWNNASSFGLVNYEAGSKTNSQVYVIAFV